MKGVNQIIEPDKSDNIVGLKQELEKEGIFLHDDDLEIYEELINFKGHEKSTNTKIVNKNTLDYLLLSAAENNETVKDNDDKKLFNNYLLRLFKEFFIDKKFYNIPNFNNLLRDKKNPMFIKF
jgi:hypothetical protein